MAWKNAQGLKSVFVMSAVADRGFKLVIHLPYYPYLPTIVTTDSYALALS